VTNFFDLNFPSFQQLSKIPERNPPRLQLYSNREEKQFFFPALPKDRPLRRSFLSRTLLRPKSRIKEKTSMATASQINANRENAKLSSGPKTEEGKAKSSRNNTKFGLFTTNNCVQPEEKEEYENFSTALWTTLAPADPVEEVTAAEFVRNAWRLRRCAMAEETLGEIVARFQASQNKTRGTGHPAADPMIYPNYLPAQTAIDRARTSAQNGMRRAKADLDKMQAARRKQPTAVLQVEPNPAPLTPEKCGTENPAPTIRTQSNPVPEPSPEPSVPEFINSPATGDPLDSKKAA
jgi:hypothetical protein